MRRCFQILSKEVSKCFYQHLLRVSKFEVGFSPFKKKNFICCNESLLKVMSFFYFILKAFFILKIFKFFC